MVDGIASDINTDNIKNSFDLIVFQILASDIVFLIVPFLSQKNNYLTISEIPPPEKFIAVW